MRTASLIDAIERYLALFCSYVDMRAASNRTDANVDAEDFFKELLNLIFDYDLRNINHEQQNATGIDLIDDTLKLIVQVTSEDTTNKIRTTIEAISPEYSGNRIKFIILKSRKCRHRKIAFDNPANLQFDQSADILDMSDLAQAVRDLKPDKIEQIHAYISKEMHADFIDVDPVIFDTTLAGVIGVLVKGPGSPRPEDARTDSFSINAKIIDNDLQSCRGEIQLAAQSTGRLNAIYETCAKQGRDVVTPVLHSFTQAYALSDENLSSRERYFAVIDKCLDTVLKSKNCPQAPFDELHLCVSVVMADAFMRCSVFEGPDVRVERGEVDHAIADQQLA